MAGFDPTQVPTFPVEIDWSHPLADGLLSLFIPGNGMVDLVTGLPWTPQDNPQLGGCMYGPGLYLPANGSGVTQPSYNSPVLQAWQQPLNIGLFAVGYFEGIGESNYPTIITVNGVGASLATTGSPVDFTMGTLSGNGISISQSSPIATAMVGTTGPGGSGFTVAGVGSGGQYGGTPTYSSTTTVNLGGGNASNGAVLVAGGFFNATNSPLAFAADWLRVEPFAMLRPVRRRTYFVPASAPSSNIGASLVATSSLSASLRGIGAIRASAAATSQVTSSLKGVGTVGASLAGSSQVSASTLGAGKLGADLLATSALSASTRGAGSLKASLIGSSALSAAAHGVGTIGAHLAATSTLSSGWLVPSTLGASLVATSALSVSFVGAFPILPGRSISVLPSIRFIVAPVPIPIPGLQFRVPTFSPRAPNDVDFFTVDLGETGSSLIGTPAVTVPTGDLTIAGVTVSGSQVTFTVSGPGTPAAYSQLAIAWQTGNGAFSQTFQVLTNGFVAAIPVNSPAGILLPAPFFGSRATGDVSYFQLDMTGIVPAGAAITSAIVSCPTGDMTVGAVLSTATSVAWEGSGSGTIGQASGFAVQVALSTGAQLTFFAAIETMASP